MAQQIIKGFGSNFQSQIDTLSKRIDSLEAILKVFCWLGSLLLIAVVFCILTGCGGGSADNGPRSGDTQKIVDWQNRERNSSQILEYEMTDFTGDLYEDVDWIVRRLPYIRRYQTYDQDTYGVKDYWQTSEETMNVKEGDCEDMSILVYMVLLDSGILDYYNADLFIRWVVQKDKIGHAFCIIKSEDGQLVTINNMHVSEGVIDYWDHIVADFNLYSIYWGGVKI